MQKLLPLGIYIIEISTQLRKIESWSTNEVFLKDKSKILHIWKMWDSPQKTIGNFNIYISNLLNG